MTYECVPRPCCPACGAEWNDEMVALFDLALGIGCACCVPYGMEVPDIECHACGKLLYTSRDAPAEQHASKDELDLTPLS